ncbi:BcsE family c-di-GMP-binding protein [Sutterella sp.]|uniref:BcsE family c-di-GMP-binding protein n=1 Tax=Sutterella sp. TaxID=1981025 RepID=UPI0026DF3FF0|nr:BcsE family c-di-GMP-binding protein [Sutterella sp.]MDO5532798.1 BcsE family c-di-GMP-binding protein [Sutterella sp.]
MTERKLLPPVTLGIAGLSEPLRTIMPGTVSVVLCERLSDALAMILDGGPAGEHRTDDSPPSVVLETPERAEIERAADGRPLDDFPYRWSVVEKSLRGTPRALYEASRSIRALIGSPATYTALLLSSEGALAMRTEALDECLGRIEAAARESGAPVLVSFAGGDTDELASRIERLTTPVSGLARVAAGPAGLAIRTRFWRAGGWSAADTVTKLTGENGHLAAPETAEGPAATGSSETVYSASPALKTEAEFLQRFVALETNEEVFRTGLERASSTLVFNVTGHADVRTVGRMITDLRRRRGRHLKIAVTVTGSPLRASSEAVLLSAGANIVFEAGSRPGHIRVMLQSLHGVVFPHDPPSDFEALIGSTDVVSRQGLLDNETFLSLTERAVTVPMDRQYAHGTLIVLEPVHGLSAEEAMQQFAPQRSGDIGTVLGNRGAVFLAGCHPSFVELSMRRAFLLDPAHLFNSYRAAFDDRDVIKLLGRCREFMLGHRPSRNVYGGYFRPSAEPTRGALVQSAPRREVRLSPNPVMPVRVK